MHDVYIVDEEFISANKMIADVCGEIDALFEEYLNILAAVTNSNKMSGQTAEALRAFADCAKQLSGSAAKVASSHQTASTNFLTQVDDTDTYLYD